MPTTYTFAVTELLVAHDHNDVVTRVKYNYKGVDENGYSGSFAGVTPMPTPSGSFIPFEDLTEEEVIELSKKAGMIEAEQVEEKINPTPEDLVRLEEALKNLEEKSKIEEPVDEETQGKIKRLSYTKNG